mmetsp:Transcript_12126/g.34753  ORF Transcript_12126/g.34753 Transcript_12126/m.34753 type:complete len:111 (-) Transcript_12126:100-432(-)
MTTLLLVARVVITSFSRISLFSSNVALCSPFFHFGFMFIGRSRFWWWCVFVFQELGLSLGRYSSNAFSTRIMDFAHCFNGHFRTFCVICHDKNFQQEICIGLCFVLFESC